MCWHCWSSTLGTLGMCVKINTLCLLYEATIHAPIILIFAPIHFLVHHHVTQTPSFVLIKHFKILNYPPLINPDSYFKFTIYLLCICAYFSAERRILKSDAFDSGSNSNSSIQQIITQNDILDKSIICAEQ